MVRHHRSTPVLLTVAALLLGSCAQPSVLDDPVVIGVGTGTPGVHDLDPVTQIRSGLDVDLMNYVVAQSARPGATPPIPNVGSVSVAERESRLILGAQHGGVNMVFSSYTITEKRELQIDFSRPYLSTHQGIMVRADDPRHVDNPAQLARWTVCDERGSVTTDELRRIPGVIALEENSLPECIRDLRARHVDAVSTDELLLWGWAHQAESGPSADRLRVEQGVNFGPIGLYAVGLRPEPGTATCELVSGYVDRFVASPEWDATLRRYFGPDFPVDHFRPGKRPCVADDDPGVPPH